MTLLDKISNKKMVIVGGSGGVGKTTLAAAIALKLAKAGKKTLVLTIDPAKRLASTLGLERFQPKPQKINIDTQHSLWAMLLDVQHTFDTLIRTHAPTEEIAETILKNKIYQHMASAMASTQEYIALEKLYELHEKNEFDAIVLDTPPSAHALSFIEAPDRLANFLDGKNMEWFLKPYAYAGKWGFRILSKSSKMVLNLLEKVTGLKLLQDLSEFMLSLESFYEGFRDRTLKAKSILKSPQTSFLIVTVPEFSVFEDTVKFQKKLSERQIRIDAILVNRMTPLVLLTDAQKKELESLKKHDLSGKERSILSLFEKYQHLAEQEKRQMAHLKKLMPSSIDLFPIPFFEKDISSIQDLHLLNLHLFHGSGTLP
ncbi:MAG: ArsA family ATPase [Deltaproteobacteria bacterium]|nr:ArsA family ATPase [Deltaproteobacteria bacterium]